MNKSPGHARRFWIFSALILCALFALTPYIYGIKGPVDSIGLTPITDLGAGLYMDEFQGGLYPGGRNVMPHQHFLAGVLKGQSIEPLDAEGNPDPNGKMVLMSLGFSNPSQEWCNHDGDTCSEWTFTGQAEASPDVNHDTLAIINGAFPGNGARMWLEPDFEAYDRVLVDELTPAGLTEAQVVAAWVKLEQAPGNPEIVPVLTLPLPDADARVFVLQVADTVRAMKIRYPNIKFAFISSRIYGGQDPFFESEPRAYENAFGVKWVIEEQISQMAGNPIDPEIGDLNYDTAAPLLVWGPYLWADGVNPREDGLSWPPEMFEHDGRHPLENGETIIGGLLLDHFLNHAFSEPWFRANDPPAGGTLSVVVPNGGETFVRREIETIAWTSTGEIGADVSVSLSTGAQTLTLTSSTPNDGSLDWRVPPFIQPGSGFEITVTSVSDPSITDKSDAPFSIGDGGPASSITVLSPNGGENITGGTVVTISWSFTEDPGPDVRIRLLRDAQSLAISDSTPNDGTFDWTVPAFIPTSSNFKVQVTSLADLFIFDTSDANFTITSPVR